ncbi:methionyl-tRNA formyltransferase [Flavobacterium sp. RS13.1]|uniref:methionyl-tRNA formyltransferase n=1 Tax=Flavobacterium sp. RS13.1 TaxID=3400345 RepID=UPI003AAAFA4F
MNDVNIGFFMMGKKGFKSLEFLLRNKGPFKIKYVVGSKDNSIVQDYFQDISFLCSENDILFIEKKLFDNRQFTDVNLIFAIGWRWLIKENLDKIIVFHDSLLPKYRGFNPLVTCLIEGENEIGVTALLANEKMDSGNIVGQESIKIKYPIKIEEAIDLVSQLYSQLLYKTIVAYVNKEFVQRVQKEKDATYSLWRNNDDYKINWHESSKRIRRFVDAVGFPYNSAFVVYNDHEISVLEVSEQQDLKIINRIPGKIFEIIDNKPLVVCGKGMIRIEKAVYRNTQNMVNFNLLRVRL